VAASADKASTLYAGELEIRLGEGLVLATGRALALSVREFELLGAMAMRAGTIVTRADLYAEVWGGELRPGDRSVDVYVSKLRGKLEAAMPDRRFIHTHPGFGYRFQPQPAQQHPARETGARNAERGTSIARATRASGAPAEVDAIAGAARGASHSGADAPPHASALPSQDVHIGAAGD
jgi:DNA-binding winged helix-turn-helix (wHTH) protein